MRYTFYTYDERRRFTSDNCRITSIVTDALPDHFWVMIIGMADEC